ncbi:8507_t:CDS:2, partial [Ambispora gerdemannii]
FVCALRNGPIVQACFSNDMLGMDLNPRNNILESSQPSNTGEKNFLDYFKQEYAALKLRNSSFTALAKLHFRDKETRLRAHYLDP